MGIKDANGKRLSDYIGSKFGRLLILEEGSGRREPSGRRRKTVICRCDCGKKVEVDWDNVKGGTTRSCGCLRSDLISERRSKNLTGMRFGKWTVLDKFETPRSLGDLRWICECDCGTVRIVLSGNLLSGISRSCGCGMSKGEEKIANILSSRNVEFKREYTFPDLRLNGVLYFDFAICRFDQVICLIEFQGIQHYVEMPGGFGDQQRLITDKMKRTYCEDHGIKLFEIRYDESIEEKLEEILLYVNSVLSSSDGESVTTISEESTLR